MTTGLTWRVELLGAAHLGVPVKAFEMSQEPNSTLYVDLHDGYVAVFNQIDCPKHGVLWFRFAHRIEKPMVFNLTDIVKETESMNG